MSAKNIKAVKRETRRVLKAYAEEIAGYLKPKPKYMPWWLFRYMQRTTLRLEKIDPTQV